MALRNGPKSKMLGANSRKSSLFRFGIPGAPNLYLTHILIQVIVLQHGEEGGDRGEVEEQQNLSGGVDLALRNSPESKMLGADIRKSLIFWFGIPLALNLFQLWFSFK